MKQKYMPSKYLDHEASVISLLPSYEQKEAETSFIDDGRHGAYLRPRLGILFCGPEDESA
jgi:hypothetical protein